MTTTPPTNRTPRPPRETVEADLRRRWSNRTAPPAPEQGMHERDLLAVLPDDLDAQDRSFVRWLATVGDTSVVAGMIRLWMLAGGHPAETRECGHDAAVVTINHDHWLGRMAFHLDLLLRHLQADDEMGDADHRSVAVEMTRSCLEEYQLLRDQQTAAARLAEEPCRLCTLATAEVA